MRISPLVIASRPAIRRSSVDLPHPEGPTSTTNSPSSMSRLMLRRTLASPYDLHRSRMRMAATSALDGAGGEALHQIALNENKEHAHRQQCQDAGRHHLAKADREGTGGTRRVQHEREQQFAPSRGEYETKGCRQPGQRERHDDSAESRKSIGAVQHR